MFLWHLNIIFSNKYQNKFIMKTSKIFTTILLITAMVTSTFAQQTERVLAKSFNLHGKQIVVMEVEGNVEVKEWNNEIVRVQMSIELTNGTSSMLKSLVKARRYNLVSTEKGDEVVINIPNLEKQVKVRGTELIEKISYTVFAPADVQVKLANESSASNTADTKDSSAL